MKKYLIIISIIIFVIVSKAQVYTQFNIGYSIPIYEKNDTWINTKIKAIGFDISDSHKKSINFSAFSGLSFNLKTGYILKNKFQFELGFSYFNNYKLQISNNNKTTYDSLNTETLGTPDPYLHLIEGNSYFSKYYSINPSVAYIASIKKFSFTFLLGSSFQQTTIFKDFSGEIKTNKDDWIGNSTSNTYEYYSIVKEYFPSDLNIIVHSGLGIAYNFANKISLIFNANFPLYSQDIILPNTKTKYYSNFEAFENGKLTYNKEETEEEVIENTDNYSFNTKTISFSLGVRYTFGKKEKTETE